MASSKSIRRFLLCLLLWVVLIPIFITLVIIPCTILLVYRCAVILASKILQPDFGDPVSSIDFAFSFDDFHGAPCGAIASVVTVEGNLNVENVYALFRTALQTKEADFRRLTTLVPTFWCGYPFWRNLKKETRIENHFEIDMDRNKNFEQKLKEWFKGPFKRGQPLWDVLLIPGYTDCSGRRVSTLALRFHHMMGDGLSLFYFVKAWLLNDSMPMIPRIRKTPIHFQIMQMSRTLFWMPLVTWHNFRSLLLASNEFSNKKISQDIFIEEAIISLASLKKFRGKASDILGEKVSVMNVLLLCVSSVLRKLVLNLQPDGKCVQDVNIGVSYPSLTPHPMLCRPAGIGNHWNMAVVQLGLQEANTLNRLKFLVDQEQWLVYSGSHATNLFFIHLQSVLPRFMYAKFGELSRGSTFLCATVPPMQNEVYLCENLALKNNAVGGLQLNHMSMALCSSAYLDDMVMTITINNEIVGGEVTKEKFTKYLEQQIHELF